MKNNDWETVSDKPIGNFRIFNMREITAKSPRTGKEHPFIVLEGNDWINIIALTPEKKIVLVKQYRFGTSKSELEIPGGIIETGENPVEAGIRELKEETGYVGTNPTYLHYDNIGLLVTRESDSLIDTAEKTYAGQDENGTYN